MVSGGQNADLVERLRREGRDAFCKKYSLGMWWLCAQAADEIERLNRELAAIEGRMNPLSPVREISPPPSPERIEE